MFLALKARGASIQDFLSLFSSHDFVSNDRKVGSWFRASVLAQLAWQQLKTSRSNHFQMRSTQIVVIRVK